MVSGVFLVLVLWAFVSGLVFGCGAFGWCGVSVCGFECFWGCWVFALEWVWVVVESSVLGLGFVCFVVGFGLLVLAGFGFVFRSLWFLVYVVVFGRCGGVGACFVCFVAVCACWLGA